MMCGAADFLMFHLDLRRKSVLSLHQWTLLHDNEEKTNYSLRPTVSFKSPVGTGEDR